MTRLARAVGRLLENPLGLGVAFLAVLVAMESLHIGGIPCFFKALTGYDCPGCGISRGFLALFQGRFLEAWQFNPLFFTIGPFLMLWIVGQQLGVLKYQPPRWVVNGLVTPLAAVMTLVFTVWRNW